MERAAPERLLALNRGHWSIENRVHYIRDKVFREDQCRIRTGVLPRVVAALSNVAIPISRLLGVQNMARFTGRMHSRPRQAVALVAG